MYAIRPGKEEIKKLKENVPKKQYEIFKISQTVRSTSLFKLENRNWTRLVQKPNWTRFMGKSEKVYSGTRTFWLFRDQTNRKSVYRSTHFHFCP